MSLVSPVLVGRVAEAELLAGALESARRRHGSAVFLVGEPGIGKSRLAAEAVAAAGSAVRLLRGRAGGGSAVPFRALSEAVFSALRSDDAPDSTELGAYWPVLARLAPAAVPGATSAMDDPLVVRAEAFLRLLARVSDASPSMLLLEDLHDADAETLAVVDYLLDNLAQHRVLLIATLRSEPGPALDLAHSASARRVAQIVRLARFTHDETAQLAARCLETDRSTVPAGVLADLERAADGVPFVIEELLGAMVESGRLRPDGDGWRVDGTIDRRMPATVAAAILQRVDRLEPACAALLEAAAVLGHRFSVRIAARVAGVDPALAYRQLRPASRAQLIVPDHGGDADWQAFRHALTVDAIRGRLLPGERASLSRAAADAVESAGEELGEDWCPLAAELWAAGGERDRAAALFTRAGRAAVTRGALLTAVELLERGLELADAADAAPGVRADLLEELAGALVLTGDTDRVFALGRRVDAALVAAGAPVPRRIAAHVTRARAAAMAGSWEAGLAEIAAAKELAGDSPPPSIAAPIDAVDAHLALCTPRPDRVPAAAALARRAGFAAEAVPLPEVALEAIEALARCVRQVDLVEAQTVLERALPITDRYNLTIWRIRVLLELGVIEKLRHTGAARLLAARAEAETAGAVVTIAWVDLHLSTVYMLHGDYDEAVACATRALERARQLRMRPLELLCCAALAGVAASRASRSDMEQLLVEVEAGPQYVLGYGAEVWGWCRGTCSLLEEDHERAAAEFARAAEADRAVPSNRASGYRGPDLLLRVVRGEAGWADVDDFVDAHLPQVHWHRPFLAWSRAVLLGREGRPDDASKAAAEALAESRILPVPRHLGARLVAESALADGWGDPVAWLRAAEEHFHGVDVPRVAAACRALLRQAGAPLSQRRRGHEEIPDELRRAGVTVREFEVFRLIADRLGNREIADRLFLSPRTVEKHVANLRLRTGLTGRGELVSYARRQLDLD